MKKLTTVSLFIFWAVVVAILTAGLLSYQKNSNSNTQTNTVVNNQNNSNSTTTGTTGNLVLSIAEVAKHSSPNDCWFVISSKVYNVTKAISSHPGGAGEIIKFCGQEATQAFDTKDSSGRPHSSRANSELTSFFIGNLNQTISGQQIKQSIQKTNAIVPTSRGNDNEFDD